ADGVLGALLHPQADAHLHAPPRLLVERAPEELDLVDLAHLDPRHLHRRALLDVAGEVEVDEEAIPLGQGEAPQEEDEGAEDAGGDEDEQTDLELERSFFHVKTPGFPWALRPVR